MGMGDSGSQTSGSSSGSELSVHVGVGCGRVSCFHVGSDERGWQLVVSGELFGEQVSLVRSTDVLGDPLRSLASGQRSLPSTRMSPFGLFVSSSLSRAFATRTARA